jgi:4-amino-4-deoxy-L-arabinose transferase-like glycosyltransferase
LFLLKGINLLYFTYPDESRNAFATYYMYLKNNLYNWIVPYYNGDIRYDKPALLYYIANIFYILSSKLNLDIEVSYRLVSVFSVFLSSIIVFKFSNILFENIFYRYFSVVVFVSFVNIFVEAKAFVPEPLFTFFILISYYTFYRFYQTSNYFYLNLFLIFLGLANFSKGIVSYIVILGPILIFLSYNKYNLKHIFYVFFNRKVILGWIGHIILGYTWFILVYLFTNGEFIKNFLFLHNFGRFTGASNMHLNPLYFYFIVIIVNIIPIWELISLILANLNKISLKKYNEHCLYLIFIFIFVFVFYSLSKGKVHHYIMPIFLPLSLLIIAFIKEIIENNYKFNSKLNLGVFFILSILFSIILLVLDFKLNDLSFLNKDKIIFNLIYLNLFFTILIAFIFYFNYLKSYVSFLLFVFTFIKVILFYHYILDDINFKVLSKDFIEIIKNSSNKEIITVGDIAGVSFYNLYFNKKESTISIDINYLQDFPNILEDIKENNYLVFTKKKYFLQLKNSIDYSKNYIVKEVRNIFVIFQDMLFIDIKKLEK